MCNLIIFKFLVSYFQQTAFRTRPNNSVILPKLFTTVTIPYITVNDTQRHRPKTEQLVLQNKPKHPLIPVEIKFMYLSVYF